MGVVFLIIAGIIVLMNAVSVLGLIGKISSYCFQTNTLDKYWELFFKNGVSLRAIISSVIGTVLALGIFIIITPIILIRRSNSNTVIRAPSNMGISSQPQPQNNNRQQAPQNLRAEFLTNAADYGIPNIKLKVAGVVRIDALMAIVALENHFKGKNIPFSYEVVKEVLIPGKGAFTIPLVFTAGGKKYATYFIYTDEDMKTFRAIQSVIHQSGYANFIYFSNVFI